MPPLGAYLNFLICILVGEGRKKTARKHVGEKTDVTQT